MEFENLKNLSNPAMAAATKPWVEPGEAKSALMRIKETAGFVDPMVSAHNGLLRFQVTPTGSEVNVSAEQALILDQKFDRFARGIDLVAAGSALLLGPESEKAARLSALRERLFPKGMSVTQVTYLEESGEVELVKERLRPEDRELLAAVPTVKSNLSDAVDEWVETGTKLGELERDRARKSEEAETAQTVSRSDVVQARNRWIRVVRAILAGIDLAENLDDQTRALILQPLALATEKAAKRNRAESAETEEEPDEPQSPTQQ